MHETLSCDYTIQVFPIAEGSLVQRYHESTGCYLPGICFETHDETAVCAGRPKTTKPFLFTDNIYTNNGNGVTHSVESTCMHQVERQPPVMPCGRVVSDGNR